LIVRYFII